MGQKHQKACGSKGSGPNRVIAATLAFTVCQTWCCVARSFHGGSDPFVHVDPGTSNEARHVIDAGEHPNVGSAKAEYNDAQYVKDLRGAFSSVPRPKARWQDRYLKLMIVGETGQGWHMPTFCALWRSLAFLGTAQVLLEMHIRRTAHVMELSTQSHCREDDIHQEHVCQLCSGCGSESEWRATHH